MFTVTRYSVQVFPRRNAPGEVEQFRDRELALGVGELASRRAAGVAVYEVVGEPFWDLWREPKLIAAYGALPD